MTAERHFEFALGSGAVMLTGLLMLNAIVFLCGAAATLILMVLGWIAWDKV